MQAVLREVLGTAPVTGSGEKDPAEGKYLELGWASKGLCLLEAARLLFGPRAVSGQPGGTPLQAAFLAGGGSQRSEQSRMTEKAQ